MASANRTLQGTSRQAMGSVDGTGGVNQGNPCRAGSFSLQQTRTRDPEIAVNNVIYLVGLVVVVGFIASFVL